MAIEIVVEKQDTIKSLSWKTKVGTTQNLRIPDRIRKQLPRDEHYYEVVLERLD